MRNRVHAGPESEAERRVWAAVAELHPPELKGLVAQYEVLRYRLDMALPHLGIGFEIDGYEWHSEKAAKDAFVKDRQRQRHLESEGWRIIRFAGREAVYNPQQCVQQMALLVARIGAERERYIEQARELARTESLLRVYSVEYTELAEACSDFKVDMTKLEEIGDCEHEFSVAGTYSDGNDGYTPCLGCGIDYEFLERVGWPTGTVLCMFCNPFEHEVPCGECGRGF